jgi:D-glycero-D-manno-heptose 1,7-bisphosphate phosphatase
VKERAVFLDRDGVVNKIVFRDGQPESPRSLEEFVVNDGVRETARRLKDAGFRVIVVSNQPDVARGKMTQGILDLMNRRIACEIPVDEIYVCPHDAPQQCACRKPKPGMFLEATSRWNIDLLSSFMIGDTWKDMEAGKAAGCKTILLDTSYNQEVGCDFRVKSLSEAAEIILKTSII